MKHLSNTELDQEFAVVVKTERKITHDVLLYIQEINKRSLHLSFGYESLRDYLIKRHRYSEGSANRRIGAMRMLTEVPEVSEKIIEGSLNLSQLAVAQSALYQKQKKENIKISKEEKASLLQELENKSLDETKGEVANTLNIEIKEKKSITYGKNDSAFLNMKLTKEELAIVKECLEIMSHQAKDAKELLLNLCRKAIKAKKAVKAECKRADRKENNQMVQEVDNKITQEIDREVAQVSKIKQKSSAPITPSATSAKSKRGRYITARTRTKVFIRDQFMCRFIGEDGHMCGSKMWLQPHHIIPFAKGGENSLENLSLRCRTHNLFEAEREGLGFQWEWL